MPEAAPTSAVVMIVDDNPNNLKVLGGMLQQAGYKVRPALSGELALRSLRIGLPDLVLLDIHMPEMDGYEVCRRIKADPELADVPVIFISALQDMEDKVHAFQAGGVDYIVKPFQLEEVMVRVRTHLELAQARRALRGLNAELEQRVAERTRELAASNETIRFSMQEESVLSALLALGLKRTSAIQFLQAALAAFDPADSPAPELARLYLNRDSDITIRLGLAGAPVLPGIHLIDRHAFELTLQGCAHALGQTECPAQCALDPCDRAPATLRLSTPIVVEGDGIGLLVQGTHTSAATPERRLDFLARVSDVLSLGLERRLADDRIEHLAYHDELTGLPNRRLLADRLDLELARTRRRGSVGAILLADLDRFKTINDALGHAIGDAYLRAASQVFLKSLRGEDTLSRWGGDEFVILLPSLAADPQEAARRAHRIASDLAARLAEPIPVEGHDLQLDASVGIALFPTDGDTSDALISHADTAMYQAKQAGRNTICFYESRFQTLAEQRLRLEKDMRRALEREEFTVLYQPQTDAGGRPHGCEALVRWRHPERGMISPGEFIPLAEDSGLIVPLGTWVLRTALAQQARWAADPALAGQLGMVSVNVSSRQFHQADFVEEVEAALAATGADPRMLELEVTESLLLVDIDETIARMTRLKAMGIRFAIDDFGTGYSSLAYLKQLPIDRLKIDQSFVRDVHKDHHDAAIVGTIIAMAQHLQLGLIAEGVETEAEWVFLRAAGCPAFQGYLFGKPMPAEELAGLSRDQAGGR